MPIKIVIGPFIQPGESLSDVADCRAGQPVRLTMPGAWDDDAPLTFQVSTDSKMFNDLYLPDGQEASVKVVPGAGVIVPPDWLRSANFLRFRSGTAEFPAVQSEVREFAIAIDVPGPT